MPSHEVVSGTRSGRISASVMILLLTFSQLVVLIPTVDAGPGPNQTLTEVFSGNNSTIILRFDGLSTNSSAALEIPQNTTVDLLRFFIQYETTDPSPGQITLDFDQDGVPEWAYKGVGYGQLGYQIEFSDGSISHTMTQQAGNISAGPSTLLPADLSNVTSSIELDHTPENSGKWLITEGLIHISTADVDNDQQEEVILLSDNYTGHNDYAIGWVDGNTSNNSFSGVEWMDTCSGVTEIEVGDINGDGYDDVVLWSPSGEFCYHLWDSAEHTFAALGSITLAPNVAGVVTSDFNLDGITDIVWADFEGSYAMLQWDTSTLRLNEFDSWDYMTDDGSGSVNSQIIHMDGGDILGGGGGPTLVFVSEYDTVNTIAWDPTVNASRGGFVALPTSYQNMKQNLLWLADLNGDNWTDIITWDNGTNGSLLISTPGGGSTLYTTIQQTGMTAPEGAITTDYDQDGVLDILIPEEPAADLDDDDTTLNGSLQVFSFSTGQLVNTLQKLQPRTMPTVIAAADMTGDGRDEIIAICGESTQGLFIDSWHEVHFDFDGDGIPEATIDGFAQAQSGANGTRTMRFVDESDIIADAISLNILSYWDFFDAHGMRMVQLNSSFEMETAGTVELTNMELRYDFGSNIERLASGDNMSELINADYMEFGSQNFNVSLPFNATLPGQITLDQLVMVTSPGHPRLPDLDQLNLTLNNMQDDSADIGWNMVTTGGSYFSQYSLYRSTITNASFPVDFSPLTNLSDFTTLSFTDTGLLEGGHYEYVIQVEFDAEGTLLIGNISDALQVDVPSIPRVENVTAADTLDDNGGMITVSWSEIDRFDGQYNIFVRGENFNDTTLLTPSIIAANTATSITSTMKSGVNFANGSQQEGKLAITNEEPLWVAVVAINESGFNPFVSPYGPIYALNNDVRPTTLTLDLSTPTVLGESQPTEDWIVDGALTYVSMTLSTADGAGVEGAQLLLNMTIAETHFVEFNATTDVNGDAVVEFMWQDIASATIQTDGGDVTFEVFYTGRSQTLEKGPLAASDEDMDAEVVVPATFGLLTTAMMTDENGFADLTVELIAEHAWQQPAFTGTEIEFKIYRLDGTLANSEDFTLIDSSGILTASVQGDANGGWAIIRLPESFEPAKPDAWRITDNMEFNATLYAFNETGQTNMDLDADSVLNEYDLCPGTPFEEVQYVDEYGCSPSQVEGQVDIVNPTLDCPDWSISNIKNSMNDPLECTLDNTANTEYLIIEDRVDVTVGVITIRLDCDNFVGAGSVADCTFTVLEVTEDINKTTDNPVPSNFTLDLRFEWTATVTTQSKTVTYQINYNLVGNATDGGGDDGTGGTDGECPPICSEDIPEAKSGLLDNKMLLGGIAAGVIVLLLVIIIVARTVLGEDDDWDDEWEDDDDEEVENPLDRILGRTPMGGGYGEDTAAAEATAADARFEREPSRGRMGGGAVSRDSQQDQQDDSDYSVDEDGTEWWEDERGQWWYRTPQMDDWEVWDE